MNFIKIPNSFVHQTDSNIIIDKNTLYSLIYISFSKNKMNVCTFSIKSLIEYIGVSIDRHKGKSLDIRGEVKGIIIDKLNGEGGFGYDPLFYNEKLNKTFGEASKEEKNSVSHRGEALKELKEKIYQLL